MLDPHASRDPEMNAKVNNAVKFREWWRPFAPWFKKEAAPEYLESAYDSPFMILTAPVHTPTDALRTFFSSGMNALVIGSFLVEK